MFSAQGYLSLRNLPLLGVRYLRRPPVNTTQLKEGRRTGVLAMKVGMLAIWDKYGERHPVTVLQVDNCRVINVKRDDTDGYTALQLGIGEAKRKNVGVCLAGQYAKAGVPPQRQLQEFRVTPDAILEPGTRIHASHFVAGQFVDVAGVTKGKGFAGVMKRWGFGGGRATHGNSLSHRVPGSTGQRQDPGKVFKGKKMPGRMGGERRTMQNLRVMRIDPVRDLLYVKGAVAGVKGGFVRVTDATKGPFYPTPPPFPTMPEEDWAKLSDMIEAPVPDVDTGIPKVPDNMIV